MPGAGPGAATGGPFVPFKVNPDGTPFEREVAQLQDDVRLADRLRAAMPAVAVTVSARDRDPFTVR